MNSTKILPVKGTNLIDIFHGEGWYEHSRYRKVVNRVTKKAIYVHVSGIKLNMQQLKDLYSKVKN